MKQSRTMSMVEATANVVVGYVLDIATQIVVFPWFGIETGLAEHLTIGLAFVGVSLARGYLLRRLFEAIRMGVSNEEPPPGVGRRHVFLPVQSISHGWRRRAPFRRPCPR